MTRRFWLLTVVIVSLTAGGVWAGMTLARTQRADVAPTPATAAKPADCCDDPTCPPGCDESCPPNCCSAKAAKKSCCPDGECCDGSDCCEDAKAPAATVPTKKFTCLPCPFCPGF